jgi:hypothetical protein
MISERKIPAAAVVGAHEIPLGGFSPREALMFLAKLGLDLSDSAAPFAALSIQVDGHPVMLRTVAKELPSKPSFAEVFALTQQIPSVAAAGAFLTDLSNRIFFELLRTEGQEYGLLDLLSSRLHLRTDSLCGSLS